jgi:hypothetical protein
VFKSKKIPIGVFFKEERPVFSGGLPHLAKKLLVKHGLEEVY